MATQLISDETWERICAVLPPPEVDPAGGRPAVGNRQVLTGVLFVLKTGIAWQDLPTELGCGCGMTCLRRIRKWQQDGVWDQIQAILKPTLRHPERFNWSRIVTTRRSRLRGGAAQRASEVFPRLVGSPSFQQAEPERIVVGEGLSG